MWRVECAWIVILTWEVAKQRIGNVSFRTHVRQRLHIRLIGSKGQILDTVAEEASTPLFLCRHICLSVSFLIVNAQHLHISPQRPEPWSVGLHKGWGFPTGQALSLADMSRPILEAHVVTRCYTRAQWGCTCTFISSVCSCGSRTDTDGACLWILIGGYFRFLLPDVMEGVAESGGCSLLAGCLRRRLPSSGGVRWTLGSHLISNSNVSNFGCLGMDATECRGNLMNLTCAHNIIFFGRWQSRWIISTWRDMMPGRGSFNWYLLSSRSLPHGPTSML